MSVYNLGLKLKSAHLVTKEVRPGQVQGSIWLRLGTYLTTTRTPY